jgi:hypothetical protein
LAKAVDAESVATSGEYPDARARIKCRFEFRDVR